MGAWAGYDLHNNVHQQIYCHYGCELFQYQGPCLFLSFFILSDIKVPSTIDSLLFYCTLFLGQRARLPPNVQKDHEATQLQCQLQHCRKWVSWIGILGLVGWTRTHEVKGSNICSGHQNVETSPIKLFPSHFGLALVMYIYITVLSYSLDKLLLF